MLAIHLPNVATHLHNLATHLHNLATHLHNIVTHLSEKERMMTSQPIQQYQNKRNSLNSDS